MSVGVLNLLCTLSQDEVEEIGIPFVRSIIEKDLSEEEKKKWDPFWVYFMSTWMPNLDGWNICRQDGKYKELMNRTNNGLERYNCRFNGLFDKQPSLMEFVEIVEEESRMMAQRLEDIRMGKEAIPTYEGASIPKIPEGYNTFKKNAIKKAKKAKKVAAAAAKKAKKA